MALKIPFAAVAALVVGVLAASAQPTSRLTTQRMVPVSPAVLSALTLVRPETAADVTPAQRGQLQLLHASPGIRLISVARLDPARIRQTAVGQNLALDVEPGVRVMAQAAEVEPLQGGMTLWRGVVAGTPGTPPGMAEFVINGDKVTGTVRAPNGDTYQLRPLPDGGTAVVKIDFATMPKDEPAGGSPRRAGHAGPRGGAGCLAALRWEPGASGSGPANGGDQPVRADHALPLPAVHLPHDADDRRDGGLHAVRRRGVG